MSPVTAVTGDAQVSLVTGVTGDTGASSSPVTGVTGDTGTSPVTGVTGHAGACDSTPGGHVRARRWDMQEDAGF